MLRGPDGQIHDPVEDLDESLQPHQPLSLYDPARERAIAALGG